MGAVAELYGVESFNRFVLMSLPIVIRMVCMILTYWLIALIPAIVMVVNKDKLTDYGFSKEKMYKLYLLLHLRTCLVRFHPS